MTVESRLGWKASPENSTSASPPKLRRRAACGGAQRGRWGAAVSSACDLPVRTGGNRENEQPTHQACSAAHWVSRPGVDVIDVVEVEDGEVAAAAVWQRGGHPAALVAAVASGGGNGLSCNSRAR